MVQCHICGIMGTRTDPRSYRAGHCQVRVGTDRHTSTSRNAAIAGNFGGAPGLNINIAFRIDHVIDDKTAAVIVGAHLDVDVSFRIDHIVDDQTSDAVRAHLNVAARRDGSVDDHSTVSIGAQVDVSFCTNHIIDDHAAVVTMPGAEFDVALTYTHNQ